MVRDKVTKRVSEIQMDFTPGNITVDKMLIHLYTKVCIAFIFGSIFAIGKVKRF